MYNRREFSKLALATIPAAAFAKVNSTVSGVRLGAQSYSFRDRSLDEAIKGYVEAGLGFVELWQGHIEPPKMPREELRKWRTTVSLREYEAVRRKFDDAGLTLYAYNYSFRDDYSDEEIARGFEMAKALGVKVLTASSTVTAATRVDPHAKKTKIKVGMHNHSVIKPNEYARPEDFEEAMRGKSEYIAINLDIGHFTAAGFDAVDYMEKNAKRIVTLHIKDRKKNQGANVPFGEGDTPITPVLQLLKSRKLGIPAMIEYEYKGQETLTEVKRCAEYCRKAVG